MCVNIYYFFGRIDEANADVSSVTLGRGLHGGRRAELLAMEEGQGSNFTEIDGVVRGGGSRM